jgi:hypothetical protein
MPLLGEYRPLSFQDLIAAGNWLYVGADGRLYVFAY